MSIQKEQLKIFKEIQSQLELRISDLERKVPEYPRIRIPDYSNDLKLARRSIESFLTAGYQKQMAQTVEQIRQLVESMPPVVVVQHHHHFAKLTKRVVVAFTVLIALLGLAIWVAYYFYKH
ncbi:hypothetical protein [Pedobacter nanyangensis]|uniref:hypothetical protein n=1 Tax=Pedobacter nanyangensis TaxID=1562389 RepID=UPI0013B3F25D|nr:hypothetical protein [Pedobacter nanyangensis]